MLDYLHLKDVGLAPELHVHWAERINVIAGENGLGKSFLLDLSWWALTRTWAGLPALPPNPAKPATIEYGIRGRDGTVPPVRFQFSREEQSWLPVREGFSNAGIVIFVRTNGNFSIWDPVRNMRRRDPARPDAFHFQVADVWDGLDLPSPASNSKPLRICEGLERDWVSWQEGRKPQFQALEAVLEKLSPQGEPIRVGPPRRVFLGEGRDRPTLLVGGQSVPVALASAGIRRILALAYLMVWAWHEHRMAAELLGRSPEDRFIILFDEPETHLHPRWQRTIIPSLLAALDVLRGHAGREPQLLLATHAPLIAASLEPYFDSSKDDLIHLTLRDAQVIAEQGGWATQGDATNWLVSETFGLQQARSLDAEQAIEAAEAFMRGEPDSSHGPRNKEVIHRRLQRLLAPGDGFWPRWMAPQTEEGVEKQSSY
jgi:hypothetical protein